MRGNLHRGAVPWYVGFKLKRTTPDCRVREWDNPHPFSFPLVVPNRLHPLKSTASARESRESLASVMVGGRKIRQSPRLVGWQPFIVPASADPTQYCSRLKLGRCAY